MKIEIRADGMHIAGYVNATEKMSRPVITGTGRKVIEIIEPRAFENAISKAENVPMTKDHNEEYVLAETRAGNLTLYEDAIGLHADALVVDEETIAEARAGKLKGWSFGFRNPAETIEERADALPLRRLSAFDLDHITLVVNKSPAYAATSIEMRADEINTVENRMGVMEITRTSTSSTTDKYFDNGDSETVSASLEKTTRTSYDNSDYASRIKTLKGE